MSQRFTEGLSSLTYYPEAPTWEGRPCAAVGQFDFATVEEGVKLLKQAIKQAKNNATVDAILGPMNGDTWHSYRVISETNGRPAFPIEPISGPCDQAALQDAGFETVSRYASTIGSLKVAIGPQPVIVPDVTIAAWDGQGGDALVDQIYAMSAQHFEKNKFFKPVDLTAFQALYRPMINALDARFVLLAYHKSGAICGFAFGYPADAETIVLKTYASGLRGVGHALADKFHRTAQDAGFTQVIHGLMQDENDSLAHSAKHGLRVFRRYDLMARIL